MYEKLTTATTLFEEDRFKRILDIAYSPGNIVESMPVGSLWYTDSLWLGPGYVIVISNCNILREADAFNTRIYAIELLTKEEKIEKFWFSEENLLTRLWEECFTKVD